MANGTESGTRVPEKTRSIQTKEGMKPMLVKHLIRELQKCDPDKEVVMECDGGTFDTWCVEEQPGGGEYDYPPMVCIFAADPDPASGEYDNKADTPNPA